MKRRNAIGMFVGGLYAAVGLKFSDPAKIREKKKPHCACCQDIEAAIVRDSEKIWNNFMKERYVKKMGGLRSLDSVN